MSKDILEAKIFELEIALANAELDRDVAFQALQLDIQSRERHALQIIKEIAYAASSGSDIPNIEGVKVIFGQWVRRQKWNKSQFDALLSAEDALEDIICGRIKYVDNV